MTMFQDVVYVEQLLFSCNVTMVICPGLMCDLMCLYQVCHLCFVFVLFWFFFGGGEGGKGLYSLKV